MTSNLNEYTDKEAERVLIAHLLKNKDVDDITSRVEADQFSSPFLGHVYATCLDYVAGVGKGMVDRQAIINILQDQQQYADVQIHINKLSGLDLSLFPPKDYLIQKITGLKVRRSLISRLAKNLELAQDKDADIHKLIADAEEDMATIDECGQGKLELVHRNNLMKRRQEGLKRRYYSKPIYTGWEGFDNLLSNGFLPGKLSVIAGRTSMGKSMFKTNMIVEMCKKKIGVLNVCPEQGFDSEHDRIDSVLTGKHLKSIARLRELKLDDSMFPVLKNSSQTIIDSWNYVCVPTRAITVAGVRSAIRRSRRNGIPIDIVFIDLFDRLKDVNVAKDRTGQISVKLGQLEQIADEEQVHVCILVQVNRGTEGRKDKRPTLADLRDCGSYEQDADMVMLLYREGYYNKDIADNMLEVIMAKQRDGPSFVYEFLVMSKECLWITPSCEKRHLDVTNVQGN